MPNTKRHPNYKAYLAQQLQKQQERFPFLSTRQVKAKIYSRWESFSPEQKNNWGTPTSKGINNVNVHRKGINESSHTGSEENSPSKWKSTENFPNTKKVTFMEPLEPISNTEDAPAETSKEYDATAEIWPETSDFDKIMKYKLDIEYGATEEDPETEEEQSWVWSLFGDSTFSTTRNDHAETTASEKHTDSREMGELMCNLFENTKSKVHSRKSRVLSCCDEKEKQPQRTRYFEEDHEFFA